MHPSRTACSLIGRTPTGIRNPRNGSNQPDPRLIAHGMGLQLGRTVTRNRIRNDNGFKLLRIKQLPC